MENRDQWGNVEQQESKVRQKKEEQENKGLENKGQDNKGQENKGQDNKNIEKEGQENKEYQFIREKVISKRKKRLERMGMAFVFTVFLAVVFGVVARAVFLYADGPLRKIMGMGEENSPSPTPSSALTPTPLAAPTEKPSDSKNPGATKSPNEPTQPEAMGDGEGKNGATGISGYPGASGTPNQPDPGGPNHSGDSNLSPTPGQGNPDGSGQGSAGNNPSGDKNLGQTEPGKDGAGNDPSGKNESGNQESENPGDGNQENSNSNNPEGSGSPTPGGPEGSDGSTAPGNPEGSKNPDSSGDSNSPGGANGENPEGTDPSGSSQAGDGDSQGNGKGENGKDGNETEGNGGNFLGYAAMFAELQGIAGQVGKSLVTVTVTVTGIDWLNDPYEAISHTTGIVIEKTAEHLLVLLNLDRIQSASSIQLEIDGGSFGAELWNYDKDYNLAVVAVESSKIPERYWNQVQVAEWGDSASLAAGTPILALGNPNGYIGSMEFGMVTSSGSTYYIMDNSVTLFNTNTTDSESGDGVIVNLEGKIIGLITRTMKSDLNASMCTAVGISNLENVLAKLTAGEKLLSFGILGEDIPASVLEGEGLHNGIYVMEVIAESPAFEAGIKTGDIILLLDDAEVYSYSQFNTLLNLHEKGDTIRVTIRRTVRMNPQETVLRAVLEAK